MIQDTHLAAGLLVKRQQTAGMIKELQAQIDQLRADLIHLDTTIRLLDPNVALGDGVAVRPYRRNSYFARGELSRRCLTALRLANGNPVSIDNIVDVALKDKGIDQTDARVRKDFRQRFMMAMHNLARQDGIVERVGRHRNVKWKLTNSILRD